MTEKLPKERLLDPALKAKGRRPYFFQDPAADRLMAITMALAGELSVTRERLDTLERVLAGKGILAQEEIEAFRPDDDAKNARATLRNDYVRRVLRIIQAEFDELDQMKAEDEYQRYQEELARD
ncbi:MAG TPA: hypothetical protein VED40_20165 [Azospirillaceae bacterium]|nr:hypothetical protein [Azospirillaceae bacterium]